MPAIWNTILTAEFTTSIDCVVLFFAVMKMPQPKRTKSNNRLLLVNSVKFQLFLHFLTTYLRLNTITFE